MTAIGDASDWDELFPGDFIPQILDLVIETWERFEKPAPDAEETPITRRFRTALMQSKKLKNLPFLILREDVEDDFEAAEELGRKDLAFYPTHHEEVYFGFECKRLNALVKGKIRAYASEYVIQGMMRYVTGQYARFVRHGGMIGYVLDGRTDHARGLVQENIHTHLSELKMDAPGDFLSSRIRPANPSIRETEHKLPRVFRMHHVFLACPLRERPQGS